MRNRAEQLRPLARPGEPPGRGPRGRRALVSLLAPALLSLPAAPAGGVPASPPAPRALPRFEGPLLGGGRAGTERFRRRRGIVYLFSWLDPDAEAVAGIVKRLQVESREANLALLGVSRDGDPALTRKFVETQGLRMPILLDPDLSISRKLGIPAGSSALLAVNSEGALVAAFTGLEAGPADLDRAWEEELRRALHLPPPADRLGDLFGLLPRAPGFEVESLDGAVTGLDRLRGHVGVLVFFLPTCPHCRRALRFLDQLARKLDDPDLVILPISVNRKKYMIQDMVEKLGLHLTVYLDPGRKAARAYGQTLGVPYLVVVDRKGRIRLRETGSGARIEALLTMEIRAALEVENPLLLDRKGFSGEALCRPCHRPEHQTWALTRHAYAFDSLADRGRDRDPECLPCHTVGWGKPGGYSLEKPAPHLEGVQCESCHGRGGPHQSPEADGDDYEPVCKGCHTPRHSLRFRFAERLPEISHHENQRFSSLGARERRELLERRSRRHRTLFDDGAYVGSAACQPCHEKEHEIWAASPHARAFESLERKQAARKAECQRCHTTGFEQSGGFPAGGHATRGVGCESCHGPGSRHVREDAARRGDILELGDKCDSCVILQICGTCHDDENDPGFEFVVTDKIDLIRHGPRDRTSAAP